MSAGGRWNWRRAKWRCSSLLFCLVSSGLCVFRLLLAVSSAAQPCEEYGTEADHDQVDYYYSAPANEPAPPPAERSVRRLIEESEEVAQPLKLCLTSAEIFFRFMLVLLSASVLLGQLCSLIFLPHDPILVGAVIGAQWLNVVNEFVSKCHAAVLLVGEVDLSLLLFTLLFFIVELLNACCFSIWYCHSGCGRQKRRHRRVMSDDCSAAADHGVG